MRRPLLLLLAIALTLGLAGCQKAPTPGGSSSASPASPSQATTLKRAEKSQRKIIRKADLTLSVGSTGDAQQKARQIAKRSGGYVERSEQAGELDDNGQPERVEIVLRVDAERFDAALDELRTLGKRAGSERISAEDVTEDYVDLEARLSTKRKLETQYLKLLERATSVDDTLKVEKQLADVRTAIEQLEGKKRVLEHQITLSSITITLERERPLIVASLGKIRHAAAQGAADVVNVGGAIITLGLRLFGVLLPVFALIVLPLLLLGRYCLSRFNRRPAATA